LPLSTSFIGFLGLLRGSRYGGVSIAPDASTLVTNYEVAANATLVNGSLNAADGWSTQGSVDIANGAAVMREVSATQTRLSQVFMLNPTDRFLSFTLTGTALDDLTGAPDDAFEVALLDANTGASLLGGTGQTRTDAFLNLQADGTQNLANCVTCINNPDGSRTYRVDLAGVPAGIAANLSFDLIGFGQNGSHVTVSDVRLSGLPQLHDDAATMLEDGTLAFDPFAQVDNAAILQLGSHVVDQPAHGTVTVNADGTFSYTPAADYFGTDSFTYRLSDGPLESNLATVSITLTAVNDAPVAADVQASTAEDTPLVIALGAYASDVDSATLAVSIVAGPAHGVLTQNADGSYTYTPEANYFGADSFTYQVNDGALDSNLATVSLTVTAVNDAPTLGDLALAAVEDTQLSMNLLVAASDIDGDALTAAVVAGPLHGQISLNADGSFTYTPNLNYNGVDSFTYKVNDGSLDSSIATVTLNVAAVNDAPVAADAAVSTAEDTALMIDLRTYATDVDSNTFTAQIINGPAHGVLVANADGTFSYTPEANYNGADSFTYKLNDGALDSNVATVSLAVTAVNDAPTVGDLSFAAVEDTALVFDLRAYVSDVDSNTFTAQIVTGPAHGVLTQNADGSFTYTPDANYNGADSFTYLVNDGALDSNIATVALAIAAVNDAPVAADAAVSTAEDTALVIDLRAYATDVDSNTFTAQVINGPAHGVLVANADGTFSYTPDANYFGADSFTYKLNDGALDSNVATVSLNVTAANDAPAAGDLNLAAVEDTPLSMNLLAAASDIDGDALAAAIVAGPQHGQVSINADGSFTYTPDLNYNGLDSFTYKVNDGSLDSNIATVTLAVDAVNDAPVAADAALSTLEDNALVIDLRSYASDVDVPSPTGGGLGWGSFTAQIVNGPAHGTLVANADGSYTYTPDLNYNGADSFTYLVSDGQLDSNYATISLDIAAVNDAPVASDMQVSGNEDTPLTLNLLSNASDVDGDALSPILIAGPTHGRLVSNADGTVAYLADQDYFGQDSFTYKVTDGALESNIVTVTLDIAAVNDAPVALSAMVAGLEDTPYVFAWSDFRVSDIDSASLGITINTLPANGMLQCFNGLEWVAVAAGQRFTQTEIDAGWLCFGPDVNESGFAGYAAGGLGNMKSNYASFTYQADDGLLASAIASMTVNILPVADAPAIALNAAAGASGASAIRFATNWESVANRNNKYTLVSGSSLEGWRVVREQEMGDEYHRDRDHDGHYDERDYCDDNKESFVIWSSGDRMKDANDDKRTVQAAQNTGRNWLELGNAMDLERQAYAIERTVTTRAGITYDLGMDYAGRLGLDVAHTRIGIYVDGVQVGSYAGTSANAALNWEALNFSFVGNGTQQRIRIAVEGITASDHDDHHHEGHGYGAMLDNITLTEILPVNTGYQDSAINLSEIVATLIDTDGSEQLAVTIGAVPTGAILTDGTHAFVGTDAQHLAVVTDWNLASLSLVAPSGFVGSFALTVAATATETATGDVASHAISLPVTVLPANVSSPLVIDLNGDGVRTTAMANAHSRFDLLNNGSAIRSGWISAQDAFLAVDSNGNGRIDDRSELFGGNIGEGYAKLASFDSNRDGVVDAKDARFSELKVWQDVNGDGLTDAGELRSLAEQGIASLDTRYTVKPEAQGGNWLLERGMVRFSDGHTATMADAYFEIDPNTPKQNSTSINLRSEPEQPQVQPAPLGAEVLPESFIRKLDDNAIRFFEERKVQAPAVIDWNADAVSAATAQAEEAKKKQKGKQSANWLSDFLGVEGESKKDAASLSKLSVSLKKNDKLDS
jgi:VCBS repeat-containing protein